MWSIRGEGGSGLEIAGPGTISCAWVWSIRGEGDNILCLGLEYKIERGCGNTMQCNALCFGLNKRYYGQCSILWPVLHVGLKEIL